MTQQEEFNSRPVKVLVEFQCRMDWHNREEFQEAGHFVAGTVTAEYVHNLTLYNHFTSPVEGFNPPPEAQVLRVQANNTDEAIQLMAARIQEHFWTLERAAAVRAFDYVRYQQLKDQLAAINLEQKNRWTARLRQWFLALFTPNTKDEEEN